MTEQTKRVYIRNTKPTFPHICLTSTFMLTTKQNTTLFTRSLKKSNHFTNTTTQIHYLQT